MSKPTLKKARQRAERAECAELTAQRWFDLAWRRAMDPRPARICNGVCQYEAKEGLPPCFIGVALTRGQAAALYKRGINASEATRAGHLVVTDRPKDQAAALLAALQDCHDATLPDGWEAELRGIAADFNLTVPADAP